MASNSLLQKHILLQLLAFLVFFPIGSVFAIYRASIGGNWLTFHILFQTLGTATVAVAISLAIIHSKKYEDHDEDHDHKTKTITEKIHRWNGYLIVLVLSFQWLWALVIRRYISWDIWLNIHMLIAATIFILAGIQIVLGMKIVIMKSSHKNNSF